MSKLELPIVYRVQDEYGRGPFRPGFSRHWADDVAAVRLPTFIDEFGPEVIAELHALIDAQGGYCGCGMDGLKDVGRWFSCGERVRLERMGFRMVTLRPDRIVRRSRNQVVFWRLKPLRTGVFQLPWSVVP
jgi:hypothetical protein